MRNGVSRDPQAFAAGAASGKWGRIQRKADSGPSILRIVPVLPVLPALPVPTTPAEDAPSPPVTHVMRYPKRLDALLGSASVGVGGEKRRPVRAARRLM